MSKFRFRPILFSIILIFLLTAACRQRDEIRTFETVRTLVGPESGLAEPFGVAIRNGSIYVSDGERGKISVAGNSGLLEDVSADFDTPSGIAFGPDGVLYVADTGKHAIYKLDGEAKLVAGKPGVAGSSDGSALSATFNGPTGIAIAPDGKIFVTDTYNDRIRVIANGNVTTLAGDKRGYGDGAGGSAQFDTPLGISLWGERILVADAGNRRLRAISGDGSVITLAGNGGNGQLDGYPLEAGFVRPTAIAVSPDGIIYVADGNSIRAIGRRLFSFVETISNSNRGFADGPPFSARFNRPSGLTLDNEGRLVIADSDNGLVRRFEFVKGAEKQDDSIIQVPKQYSAEEFRDLQPPRWPYDPPDAKRDVAGTLGEIRGEYIDDNSHVRFHNGLDIAGNYGETARFVRTEKVLDPMSAENFGTLRELVRLPLMGYIHIRLGRDSSDKRFGDQRFIFSYDDDGKMIDVRIPRGSKFNAGEPIGTLNAMNHVHLIAGPIGAEMNALAALKLPNISDSIAPTIEQVTFWDENWRQIETAAPSSRITLTGKTRIVLRAYDRMDGNSERRKLGVYSLGYQIVPTSGEPKSQVDSSIIFDRNPPPEAARTVYARGSKSGPSGETIFNYSITNRLDAHGFNEGFFDASRLEPGQYTIRVFAADYFGNRSSKDIQIEVKR